MGWVRRVLESAGLVKVGRGAVTDAEVVRAAGGESDVGWQAVVGPRATQGTELDPADWRGLARAAYEAYCTNPLAYAVIEQQTNFVLGGGARVVAEDARVQRVVDEFWHDSENRMDERIYWIQTELALFGEQFIRYFVEPATGRTVIRQLDPLAVEGIQTDPEDVERVEGYWYRPAGLALAEAQWIPGGEVSRFAINRVSNALRGRSDLAAVLPWLRRYREWLLDRVRQNRLKAAFIYDVTVKGATREELNQMRAEHAMAPEPGSVLFHNEAEEWRAVGAQIGAADVRDDGRALRLMVAAGVGIPEHYLGEGGNVNRATAAEMGLPAMKRMQRRQEYLRQVLETVCGRAVTEAVRVGRLGPRAKRGLHVEFEELGGSGMEGEPVAAKGFAEALALAEDREWVDRAQARRLWWRFAGDAEEGMRREGETAAAAE